LRFQLLDGRCVFPLFPLRAWMSAALLAALSSASAARAAPVEPRATSIDGGATVPADAGPAEEGEIDVAALAADPSYQAVVTARQEHKTEFNTAVGTNVVGPERIEELMPRNTSEALRDQPGVWVQQTGFVGGAPIIRGDIGNEVIYLFDGVRRNTVSLYPGANSYLQNVDPLSIDRVEVIRGPGSVLYGSDALGGVVNVITAPPLTFLPAGSSGVKLSGQLAEWVESADLGSATGFRADATTSNVFLHVGGSYENAGNVRGGGQDGVLSPTWYDQGGLNAQVGVKLSEHDSLELLEQYFDRPRASRFDNTSWIQKDERNMTVLRYHGTDKGFLDKLEVQVYFHDQYGLITTKYWDSKTDDKTFGVDVNGQSSAGRFKLNYGLHYHRDWATASDPLNVTVSPDVQWDNAAAFLLAEWSVNDWLTFDAGLRGDLFIFTSQAPPAGASIPPGLTANALALSRTDFAPTGSIDAIVKLAPHLNYTLALSTGFRAPNENDYLAVGPFTLGYAVPPSGNLSPERSYQIETGLRTSFHRLTSSVNVFYSYLNDLIVTEPGTFNGSSTISANGQSYDVYVPGNVQSAWALGAELSARLALLDEPAQHLWLYANGSWMRGFQSDHQPLAYEYPANGTLGARWQEEAARPYFAEMEVFAAAPTSQIQTFVAASDPAYRINPQDPSSGSILQNGQLAGFALLNARAGVQFSKYVDGNLSLDNLTNTKYRMKDSRLDGPGFDVRVGVRVKY